MMLKGASQMLVTVVESGKCLVQQPTNPDPNVTWHCKSEGTEIIVKVLTLPLNDNQPAFTSLKCIFLLYLSGNHTRVNILEQM